MELFDLMVKISVDTDDFDDAVKDARKSADKLGDELGDDLPKATKDASKGLKDAAEATEKMSNGFTVAKGVLSDLISTGIQSAISAVGNLASSIWNLDESTEEYRVAQGRLNTAFETAGFSAETAQEAYNAFYGILGDTDTATEASQLLAQLADSAEDVSVWTNIAAGVSGTFGDSLPIESLIEAANETANVGTVTGVLADALNWVGISEDEFNEKLAECSSESERNQLIMQTLAAQYDEASDAFYRNNAALVESRNAQAQMDAVLAQLGLTVSTVKNNLISEFLPAIANVATAFNGMLTGVEGADEQFAEAISNFVSTAVERLPEFMSFGVQIISSIASGLIQAVPTLISSIPQIISQIGSALMALAPQVMEMGGQILTQLANGIITYVPQMVGQLPTIISEFINFISGQLPTILEQGTQLLNEFVNGIIGAIPTLVSNLPQVITSFVDFIASNLPTIIQSGIDILTNLIEGIIGAIPQLIAALPQIIEAIVSGIGSLMGSILDVGKNIVEGLWNGIKNAGSWLVDKITGWFNGVVDGVKRFLGISSPSKLFEDEIGINMALGVGEGWEKEFGDVRGQIEDGLKFDSAAIDMDASAVGRAFGAGEAGAFGGGAYAGTTININIDGARYSDENALAEAIAERMEIMTNRRGAVFA